MLKPGHLFCFGLGYSCLRLALRLRAEGWRVSGTTRSEAKRRQLEAYGIDNVRLFNGDAPMEEGPGKKGGDALAGVTHLIASIPPAPEGDPVLRHHMADLRQATALRWAGYLSTPAVYGDRGGALVHEDDAPRPGSIRGERRLAAEQAWTDIFADREIFLGIFRLSGIYGPGRSILDKLRDGTARIIDKPGQVFNRIHVDDIGHILKASMMRPARAARIYNVADDEACDSGTVIRYGAGLLGLPAPAPVPFETADMSPMARSFYSECKRLDTARLRDELGCPPTYPTYREGLHAILAGMNGETGSR